MHTIKHVAVIGLGYVGLPLAVQAAEKGYTVTGIDLNQSLVASVNRRESPFINDKRFDDAFNKVSQNSLTATDSFDNLAVADVVVICVPTPTENNIPDLKYVISAATKVAEYLHDGQLIVLESTVNPGVTREEILSIFEQYSALKAGLDYHLAHCPERIDPGNDKLFVGNLNRVVGGVTPACTIAAKNFYNSVIDADIIALGSADEAEFVKSWENSHRNVMIALANEAAMICDAMDMDISNVLKGLESKVSQFGLKLARPGIGPGGHCIPEDIHYVIQKARSNGIDTRFLDSAADLNDKMPQYAVRRLQEMIKASGEDLRNLRVGVLGLAYKEDIGDARRSPASDVINILMHKADAIFVHDPYVNEADAPNARYATRLAEMEEVLNQSDVLFIATAHKQYVDQLNPEILKAHGIRYILDGRNCLDKDSFAKLGIFYRGIGVTPKSVLPVLSTNA